MTETKKENKKLKSGHIELIYRLLKPGPLRVNLIFKSLCNKAVNK